MATLSVTVHDLEQFEYLLDCSKLLVTAIPLHEEHVKKECNRLVNLAGPVIIQEPFGAAVFSIPSFT